MSDRYFAFISYANEHREWVAKLQKDLERCLDHYARTVDPSISKRVFLDQVDLQSGRTWIDQFQEAVDQSDRLILIVSPEALVSEWVGVEWQSFFTKRPRDVFPVRIAEAELPTFLDPIQWIDFSGFEGAAYNERLRQLFGDLLRRSRRDPPPMPPELAPPTIAPPESTYASDATRDLSRQLEGAYEQRAEILATGGDATQINETIVGLKRKLREGPQLEAGDFLLDGRFKLLETLGRGGFATVWKAYDRERRDLVAIKVLHSQYSKDQSRRNRFFRGARQMAGLRHPGIVSVVETECEDGGYHFFAMEYLAGGDFRQAVLDGRPSREERLRVILSIGEALSYAHSQGVIHRDVKPANILLDLEGHAKLTDFDLVRAADTTGGTRTAMMGTIVYAAPEAMLDGKQAAEPADVFGLGMTALFALHGQDLTVDVLYEPIEFLSRLECSGSLRDVFSKSIARRLGERWASVDALCSALRELLLLARPQSETETTPAPSVTSFIVSPPTTGDLAMFTIAGSRSVPVGRRIAWAEALGREGDPRTSTESFEDNLLPVLGQRWRLAKYPVTVEEYGRFVADGGYRRSILWSVEGWSKQSSSRWSAPDSWDYQQKTPNSPVVQVSWFEAEAYCRWLSLVTDLDLRLPFETEWEQAATHPEGEYPWGSPEPNNNLANFGRTVGRPTPVGIYPDGVGPFGHCDLAGNVWEWCIDELVGSTLRTFKGGSWLTSAAGLRSTSRGKNTPTRRSHRTGFRVLCTLSNLDS